MTNNKAFKNAVLDDRKLLAGWKRINPKFGDFVTRVAGEVWGLPLIDQKTKALIALAVDMVNGTYKGSGNPFTAHLNMALQQGVTRQEIEELFLFMCVYAGFDKVASCFGIFNQIFEQSGDRQMTSATRKEDYAIRDRKGKLAFYVLLWKRKGISLELFYDYWKNVHGPLCAHLPGQHQYWQFHLDRNEGGIWPTVENVDSTCPEEDRFNGIAELTFATEADFQAYLQAFGILMADEHNLFAKAIAYNTSFGNSQTYIDRLPTGEPNGEVGVTKFHVMVKKSDAVSVEAFRQYMTDTFAPTVVQSDLILKFRLHLLEEVDNSRPNDDGVCRYEPLDKQYQAAFEIAFANPLAMETFFASPEYAAAVKDQAQYVKQILPFPERSAYTFVYDGKMTLAGQCSSKVADLILKVGATNQLKEDVVSLMNGKQKIKSNLGHYLQGVQHFGVTVDDMARAIEFYTEVLGGKLVVGENGLVGDTSQNTLFQKEELEAIASGIDPDTLDIPHLRSAKEDALDIKFISFGNVAVELIHFREAENPNANKTSVSSIPSHIGHVNAMHLSFNVKEGIDLNLFAKLLEEECHKRGMTNVVCNRIVRVKSEAERKAVALKYNSFKFWHEEGDEPEIDWSDDPMEGWSLFYCKGPSGEQLEFNQATRKVKESFRQGVKDYNEANGTFFTFPEAKVANYLSNGQVARLSDGLANEQQKESQLQQIAQNQSLTQTTRRSSMSAQFPGQNADLVKRLFSRGEAFDSAGFVTFFTDTPVYQFGNFEVCLDKESIKQSADNFFSQISAVYHEIKMMWELGDVVFVEMDVLYWRKDGSMVSLPCFDIFRVEGDKFSELRIFMDVNPVFDPSIPVPPSASVLTISQGKQIIPPGTMRRHFAEHPEGKQRVAQGYVPKWAIAGPQWQIEAETSASSAQLTAVGELSQAVIAQDWNKVKTYLTDDIFYKVGSGEPRYGRQEVVEFFQETFKNIAVFTGHKVRKIWQEPDIITLEMDAYYEMVGTKKRVTIACCDIYRMRGNKVSEWRVYADMSPWQNADDAIARSGYGSTAPKQTVGVSP